MELWEILVPTVMGDTQKPIRTRYHKVWDRFVRSLSGGLTVLRPVKGQWIEVDLGVVKNHEERMIPVRIACDEEDIRKIIDFSLKYYQQLAIMAYRVSDKVLIVKAENGNQT